eukprot:1258850-Rhodomonas_salina.2
MSESASALCRLVCIPYLSTAEHNRRNHTPYQYQTWPRTIDFIDDRRDSTALMSPEERASALCRRSIDW